MTGWEKCDQLKKIRKVIADANDIPYEIEECKHLSDCIGTCPKCDAEAEYINKALNYRAKSGKKLVIDGLLGDLFQGDDEIESGKHSHDMWEDEEPFNGTGNEHYPMSGETPVMGCGELNVALDLVDYEEMPFL